MSPSSLAVVIVAVTLAAVLLVSGVAKLRDRRATRDAFVALQVPAFVPAGPSATALPWVEIALAVLLLVSPAALAWVPAAAVLLLMLAYTALIARALRLDEPVSCSCFGRIGRHDVGAQTLARNVLLSALAAAVLWSALDGGSVPAAVADLGVAGWWALAAAAAAVAVALLVVAPPSTGTSAGGAAGSGELADYERHPIPYGVLKRLDGQTVTLTEAATTQARLVIVLNANCGPCIRTAERIDDWARRLEPAVGILAVYGSEPSALDQVSHSPDLSTWEPNLNIRRLFELGTPFAILLGADGLLAGGPVSGETEVRELVDTVLEQLEADATPLEQ